MNEVLVTLFGRDGTNLGALQILARGALVFSVALILLRVASRRFLGRYSAFDWVLSIILGSVLSRAITGSAPLFPTVAVSTLLMALHWGLGALASRSAVLAKVVHGEEHLLVRDGAILKEELSRHHLTAEDVLEEVRYQLHTSTLEDVKRGVLERNGRISVVRK
jgi:uncharacterized membrane protein YcaP (DUF421 family)